MSNDSIKVRALRTKQGENAIYSFFIKGQDIFKVADISRISRDESGQLKGLQRKPIQRHIAGIIEYLKQDNILFPNAIILALGPRIKFNQSRGPNPEGVVNISEPGVLDLPILPEGTRSAWIVDGQQRSTALSKSQNDSLNVPVIGFECPDIETQRAQFILVNKARPLPRNLIDELLPEINSPMPSDLSKRKIPSELVNALGRTEGSPFFGMIKRPSDPVEKKGIITDTALIKVTESSLNNYGALSLYKGVGKIPDDLNGMYEIMYCFWDAVREVFPDAWGLPSTDSRLMHSAGIQAMGNLMDRIVPRMPRNKNLKSNIVLSLTKIRDDCAWTEGEWDFGMSWNAIQAVPTHIKILSEYLIQLDYKASGEKN